jgi:hypothetical protein
MRRTLSAAAFVLALGLAAFAGSAAAGNGNGNNGNGVGNAPPAAAPAPAPAAAPGNSGAAPGQVKQTDAPQPATQQPAAHGSSANDHSSTHATAHTTHATPTHSTSPTTQPGVKPSNTTQHWTHTTVGASPNVSKRYGNGQTAAGIAQSRGAPSDTQLTGPGNSQPHKVSACGTPTNRSGGVDIHAVKSYDQASCTTQTQTQQSVQQQLQVPCGFTAVTTSGLLGMEHVNGQGVGVHLMTNTHSAHFSKHADDVPVTSSTTLLVPNGAVCNTSVVMHTPTANTPAGLNAATPAGVNVLTPAAAPVGAVAPAGRAASASGTGAGAGGVLGAQASLASQHHSSGAHGVLGTTAHVAGTTLPFTGLPLWAAVLIAAALIAAGSLFRRRSRIGAHV